MRFLSALSSAGLLCAFLVTPSAFADSMAHWVEVRSPHFVVLTDTNETQGRRTAVQFELMRSFFQYALPLSTDSPLPITVLALKDRKDMLALEPARYLPAGSLTLDGLFLPTTDRNYILVRLDDQEGKYPYRTIYHEYTHFVQRKQRLPVWLDEGLAQFYQFSEIHEKKTLLGEPDARTILYLRHRGLIPLSVLFEVTRSSPQYHEEEEGSIFYAESWALTHYLEFTDFSNKTHHLADYTHLLAQNEDAVTAAKHAFGDLKELETALYFYVSNGEYKQFRAPKTFTVDETSYTARPIATPDVDAIRADILLNDGRVPEARKLLSHILAVDPKDGLAHETMGSLAWREGSTYDACKEYSEAIQLGVQSYIAYYNYALLSLSDSFGEEKLIESSLRKTIELEPNFAPAYIVLSRFYDMRHKNLEEAYTLMVKAVQIAPQELDYRMNAADLQVELKQIPNAIRILEAAAKLPNLTEDQLARVEDQLEKMKREQEATEK